MKKQTAIFAQGCFWGVQCFFDKVEGVIETEVGYTGGKVPYPTGDDIFDHTEAIKIIYDADTLSYTKLLDYYFGHKNPVSPYYKEKYKSAIYYLDEIQQGLALQRIKETQKHFEKQITIQVLPATKFYRAEERHQKYSEKHGLGICG